MTNHLDPFRFAAAYSGAEPIADTGNAVLALHQRLRSLRTELRAARLEFQEVRRRAASEACPRSGVPGSRGALLTEEAIDEEIDGRRREWTSPGHCARLERERQLMKAELREYRAARAAYFERTGMAAGLADIERINNEICATAEALMAQPPQGLADLAAMFDLVVSEVADWLSEMGIQANSAGLFSALWEEVPSLARLILWLQPLAPEVEFALLSSEHFGYRAMLDALRAAENHGGADRDDERQVVEIAAEEEAEASAEPAAELSPDEAAFLYRWRELDGAVQADLKCVLRLQPDDRSAVLRLLDRALAADSPEIAAAE
jgi:hypothetical protein